MAMSVNQIDASFISALDAANSFELGARAGQPMEALLGSFGYLQDYQQAVKVYKDSGRETYRPADVRVCLDA